MAQRANSAFSALRRSKLGGVRPAGVSSAGRGEAGADAFDDLGRQGELRTRQAGELFLDLGLELVDAQLVDQDLDARLVDVVAPAVLVIDAQDRFQIGREVLFRHPLADQLADEGGAAQAAADIEGEADLAGLVPLGDHADVVGADRGAVAVGPHDRDLELARQIGEFRVRDGPLAQDLGIDPAIDDLVGGGADELVGGHVADAVAAGLKGVHVHFGQFAQDGGSVFQLDPVELEVLARGEVAVALVVFTADLGQLAELRRGQDAVGNGDAQHIGVKLEIQAVHQAQRLELVFRQFTGQTARHLFAELLHTLGDEAAVKIVIAIDAGVVVRL